MTSQELSTVMEATRILSKAGTEVTHLKEEILAKNRVILNMNKEIEYLKARLERLECKRIWN